MREFGQTLKMRSSIVLLSSLLATSLAVPAPVKRHVMHERRDVLPSSWNEARRVDGRTTLPVRIGLVQPNLDQGHDLLMDMYDVETQLASARH